MTTNTVMNEAHQLSRDLKAAKTAGAKRDILRGVEQNNKPLYTLLALTFHTDVSFALLI